MVYQNVFRSTWNGVTSFALLTSSFLPGAAATVSLCSKQVRKSPSPVIKPAWASLWWSSEPHA